MSKFTLKKIGAVSGKQVFEELEINGKGQLTEFKKELEGTSYLSEYKNILAYMSFVADLKNLPSTKFKDITPDKENIREYEFKSKHLRVYCIQQTGGKLVVLGGKKNTQKEDINKFRSLKKQYLQNTAK